MMKTKTVPFNKDYQVSTTGVVTSLKGKTPRVLKQTINRNTGYRSVGLSSKGVSKTIDIHRLVALTHIKNPNPKKYNVVNHLDGDKLNNHASNLEWTDHKSNSIHGAALPKNRIARQERRAARKESYDVMAVLKSVHGRVSSDSFSVIFKELVK